MNFGATDDAAFRRSVAFVYLSCVVLFGILLALEWRWIDSSLHAIARERGAALFSLIETSRAWNAGHGGVYVAVTDEVQPNPYLRHPARDLETVDGRRLTMINPAYMTRQIADFLMERLAPKGVGVVMEASHLCAVMRGVRKPGTIMTTSHVLGLFRTADRTRAEFFSHLERRPPAL